MLFVKPIWVNSKPASAIRENFAKVLILLIFILFVAKLAQLQVYEFATYSTRSQTQTIKRLAVTPVRGMVYDRNGVLMVYNIPSFSIVVTPYEFREEALPLLAEILNMDTSDIIAIMKRYNTYSKFTPIKILRDASDSIIARIEEYSDHLPGVDVAIDSKRIYNFDCNMAHLLGYIREITQEQLEKNKYYKPGDMVGQNGLEQSYEGLLHGRDGIKFVAINKIGQRVTSFENGKNDVTASNGFAVNLSIGLQLQELAEKLLLGKRGAIVAIDPNNGEVMVCASKPDYDPRLFSGRVPATIYNELYNDKAHPLLPRALQSQYPPGSTWKMLIALAALQEGIINENSTIHCSGGYNLGTRILKCHGACGSINVRQAIRTSCNTFFCELGVRLGMERFEKYGGMFNFGKRTQIDLPFEAKGKLPTREWLLKRDTSIKSFTGRLANFGIGQGEILVTPLQMAAYIATIANEGTYYQPHIVKSVINQITHKTETLHFDSKQLPIEAKYFKVIKDGMWMVVNAGGTGSVAALQGYNVCGKTGTAQNSNGQDHSWFVCFAPKDDPKIAMCVFVENGGWGASNAAPIAAKMLRKFFNPNEVVGLDEATILSVTAEETASEQIAD